MKHGEIWQSYVTYSKDASDIARKLSFAAAAICWFFKQDDSVIFPVAIKWALGLVVIFFICDLLHYAVGAAVVGTWMRTQEKRRWATEQQIEGDFEKPAWIDRPTTVLWAAKLMVLLGGFLAIGWHLLSQGTEI